MTLSKASIVAAHDGQLGCSKPSVQPEAIVEVKASVLLASHAKKVLMQMGIEMMIWILNVKERRSIASVAREAIVRCVERRDMKVCVEREL